MPTPDAPRTCTGTTAKGKPCKTRPLKGRDVCAHHAKDRDKRPGRTLGIDRHGPTIINSLAAGAFAQDAARAAGVHPATYFRWMEVGEADAQTYDAAIAQGDQATADQHDTPYRAFFEAATRAKGEARVAAVAYLRSAMKKDWRAAAFYLERTDPENWGRSSRVALSGHVGGSAPVNLAALSDEELDALDELVGKATDPEA